MKPGNHKHKTASECGKMARGVPKRYSKAELKRRSKILADWRDLKRRRAYAERHAL